MEQYKQEFINFMVESEVLKFGEFTLKSGRKSPFFMNAGAYVTGTQLRRLGEYYAKAIHDNYGLDFDVLFGPAYKGIPLAVATSMAISELYGKEVRYCSDRKEEKDHGADKGGFNLCVAAGYNPYSVVLTINKLEDLAKEQGNPGYGIFSSHPEPEERLKRVMKQIKALKVHPEITLNEDNTARVHEGDWGFNITQTVGNDRPEYRAYMLAGGLYCVRERDKGHIDPYRFIVYDNGGSATIYYDDIEILTVYNQDAYAGGFGSAGSYAAACTELLRQWVPVANANDTAVQSKSKDKKK